MSTRSSSPSTRAVVSRRGGSATRPSVAQSKAGGGTRRRANPTAPIERDERGLGVDESLLRSCIRDEIVEGDHARANISETGPHANQIVVPRSGVEASGELRNSE